MSLPFLVVDKCKDCEVDVYHLTTVGIVLKWSNLCRKHQMAAQLAAKSMVEPLQQIVGLEVKPE